MGFESTKNNEASSSTHGPLDPTSPLLPPHPSIAHLCSQPKTFANVFIAIVGSGVLGLPYAFMRTGWAAGTLLPAAVAGGGLSGGEGEKGTPSLLRWIRRRGAPQIGAFRIGGGGKVAAAEEVQAAIVAGGGGFGLTGDPPAENRQGWGRRSWSFSPVVGRWPPVVSDRPVTHPQTIAEDRVAGHGGFWAVIGGKERRRGRRRTVRVSGLVLTRKPESINSKLGL